MMAQCGVGMSRLGKELEGRDEMRYLICWLWWHQRGQEQGFGSRLVGHG